MPIGLVYILAQNIIEARRGLTIGFLSLWHTVELAMSTRLCLL